MATGASGIPSVMRAGRRRWAVLGRGEYGWCDAKSFPPILSRINYPTIWSRIIKVGGSCYDVLTDQVNVGIKTQKECELIGGPNPYGDAARQIASGRG
ncbi:predicted protein [Histoplasma mississippiense (nom. inval.)]|uniref:predicted protein n=1 Tax=Ajellomyces capsulatus (strain NAm1 / WU24) TaxID=2059318 RepID=UPI000157D44A|nr:predicted protein [Histoplasma mississippiense (nom. inval.)]EDN06581.1 predicted protein [Histoplasma mississippiense (nom. inval.)]